MLSLSWMFFSLFFMGIVHLGTCYLQIISQFNSSCIGPNVIIRDAIMINSSQTLIISCNKNNAQYISKYSVQNGTLVFQISKLMTKPMTVLCANSLQTELIAFGGTNFRVMQLKISTLAVITISLGFSNISQMIWSPVTNQIYFVDQSGNFGYLYFSNNIWAFAYWYIFPTTGTLRMSISPNFTYVAVSNVDIESIFIFNVISVSLQANPTIVGLNTVAHQWFNNEFLYIMPFSSGYLFGYNLTSSSLSQYQFFSNGSLNVFSFHMFKINNISQQYVIGTISGTIVSFLQLDLALLTMTNIITTSYSQNLAQIKYSISSPQKALLIFNSFIDTIDILQQCPIGYIFNSLLNNCVLNETISPTSLSVLQQKVLTNLVSISTSNSFLKYINQIPGNRRVLRPFFIFFVNLDDIQLYVYHQRQYDYTLDFLFNAIQTLQNQKWCILQFNTLWEFIGINTTFIKDNFNTKIDYTSWKFFQVQGYSSGFMINTLNLFFSNILLIFLMFLLLRTAFFILFKYQISKILRQYSFWPYLYFMMIDGNLQFVSYMYFCELQHFFSPNLSNKFGLIFMIGIFLILILLISSSHLLLRQIYKNLAKYFFQDTKTSIQASVYLILQFGYRNILLGAVHALFNLNYILKLSLLIIVQIFFLINSFFFFRKRNFFSNQTRITVNFIAALLRISLIFTYFINTQAQNLIQETTTLSIILQQVHFVIVVTYLLIGNFITFFQVSKMFYETINLISNKHKSNSQIQVNKCQIFEPLNQAIRQRQILKSIIMREAKLKTITHIDKQKVQFKPKNIQIKKCLKRIKINRKFNHLFIIQQNEKNKQIQNVFFVKLEN